MMQEEGTKSAEPVVPGAGEEKKEDDSEVPSSTVLGTKATGIAEGSIAERLDKTKEIMKDFGKTVAIDKPKQMFAEFQGMATNFKEKVVFHKPANGESGEPAEKIDPVEKSRQFFNGMKEKATANFRGFSLQPAASTTTRTTPQNSELDVTSDEAAPVAAPKNDPLERSKEFLIGMKEKASTFKIKMPLVREERFDEHGKPLPGPLDRVKADMDRVKADMDRMTDRMTADMKGLATGIREKMAMPSAHSQAAAPPTGTPDESAVFTISEDHEEEESGPITASNHANKDSDLSVRLNDLVKSARTTANNSLNSMPSLRSIYSSEGSIPSFTDKFASFRRSTIEPLSDKFGMKPVEESVVEEISFDAEPTIVKELAPEYKIKQHTSEEHWDSLTSDSHDEMPSAVNRKASIVPSES